MSGNRLKITRRGLLKAAGAMALSLSTRKVASALPEGSDKPVAVDDKLRILFHTLGPGGKVVPAPDYAVSRLYLIDRDYDPIRLLPVFETDGVSTVAAPGGRFAFCVRMDVPDFGIVWAYADNGGRGYSARELGAEVDLNDAFADSRLKKVGKLVKDGEAEGCSFPSRLREHLAKARWLLRESRRAKKDPAVAATLALESLSHSMWAGEIAALARAEHRIAKAGPRRDFLFGANAFRCLDGGAAYTSAFYNIFNYCTLPFYYRSFEPEEGSPKWSRLDQMFEWCRAGGITAKGHPLVWFHEAGVPNWLQDRSFEHVRELHRQRIRDIVSRYSGRIDIWDVINEAHCANVLNFTFDQLDEMTRVACDETKAANAKAVRVVNNTAMWGENAVPFGSPSHGWGRTPRQYLASIAAKGINYDIVGIQVYQPERDMMELDLMLDRFAKFGPLHITEQGIPSDTEPDESAHVKNPGGRWHEPWSEKIQADWIEQFWTIAFSKPAVRAITWWDFTDAGGQFWAHGGFLRKDGTPKESYWRLRKRIREWRGL